MAGADIAPHQSVFNADAANGQFAGDVFGRSAYS
jgi:hypothetical protein